MEVNKEFLNGPFIIYQIFLTNKKTGINEIDYIRYPNKSYQENWLRIYLEEYKGTQAITKQEIERLYVQVNKFALASHYLWTIWSLIQAEHSTIDFDFLK